MLFCWENLLLWVQILTLVASLYRPMTNLIFLNKTLTVMIIPRVIIVQIEAIIVSIVSSIFCSWLSLWCEYSGLGWLEKVTASLWQKFKNYNQSVVFLRTRVTH